jgi:hypothetical protein
LEKVTDIGTLAAFINNTLLPVLNTLPASAAAGLLGTACYSDTSAQDALVYDSLTGNPLTITDSMRLLYGQVQTFQTAMTYLSQQVTSLQARLSASGQDDTSLALQTIVSTLAANAAQLISMGNAISSIQLLVGTVMDSTVETPSIAAGALSAITLDWSIAFPDNTYTVSYGMEDSSGYLAITGFVYQDSGVGITVYVRNNDSSAAHQGYVHAEGRTSS